MVDWIAHYLADETMEPELRGATERSILERRAILSREPSAARTMVALSVPLADHLQRPRNVAASVL